MQAAIEESEASLLLANEQLEENAIISMDSLHLQRLLIQDSKGNQKLKWAAIAFILLFVLEGILLLLLDGEQSPLSNLLHLFIKLTVISGVVIGLSSLTYRQRRRNSIAVTIRGPHDLKQIPTLMRALEMQNRTVSNSAKQELSRLLPHLKTSDSSLLNETDRTLLIRLFVGLDTQSISALLTRTDAKTERNFQVAILKAFEQVGGAQELILVERLAGKSEYFSSLKLSSEVNEAAVECLSFIQARAKDQQEKGTLLRASSADTYAPSELLRPSSSADDSPNELLRASEAIEKVS